LRISRGWSGFVWVGGSFCVSGHPYVGSDMASPCRYYAALNCHPELDSGSVCIRIRRGLTIFG